MPASEFQSCLWVVWRHPRQELHPGIPPMRAGLSIEWCGAELLGTLLLGGKTQKAKHFAIYLDHGLTRIASTTLFRSAGRHASAPPSRRLGTLTRQHISDTVHAYSIGI